MDFRKLDGNELPIFTGNVATLLGGGDLPALNGNIRANLAAAIGDLPDRLRTSTEIALLAEAERKAAISVRNELREQIYVLLSQVRRSLDASLATKEQYELCGFDYPVTPVGRYIPQDPTGLSVVRLSSGVIRGRFAGNNKKNRIFYEVWWRVGDDGEWMFLWATSKQSFIETPVAFGKRYRYRVRAIAKRAVSNFSNTAVVDV
jgi:hypothetical protein